MYKATFIALLSVLAISCASSNTLSTNYDHMDTEHFVCPHSHITYCEGNSPENLTCECIDRQLQRQLYRSIQGQL